MHLEDTHWTQQWGAIRGDRYRVIRSLGAGAQGRILLAHHRFLDQPCVIKLVDTTEGDWAAIASERLRLEARAGVRVNHPNVARVFDCDCVDEQWYFVMEYVVGENLRKVVQRVKRLCAAQVVDVGRQVASGLAAIHEAGLIHRDIKPSNLMLTHEGAVKIMDLGLVKTPESAGALGVTWTGQVVGTPMYMPPEQFDAGAKLDGRSDVYALGATLYHLLTGRAPFAGKDFEHLAQLHRTAAVAWPSEGEEIPDWLKEVVACCLGKRVEDRFNSAAAVAEALAGGARDEVGGRLAAGEGRFGNVPGGRSAEGGARSRVRPGVVVTSFRNVSRQADDAWIGDAIAEYLASRLMGFEGVHVADRQVFEDIVANHGGAGDAALSDSDHGPMLKAAALLGVSHVYMGSFQRLGTRIRILAYGLSRESGETTHLGSVSGEMSDLFDLEDELTGLVIEGSGSVLSGARVGARAAGGTESLAAHEQYIRGKRAFERGDYREAIRLAREALRLDDAYGEACSLEGAAHARIGEYEQAVACHERQERLAKQAGDGAELAVSLGNLGAMYYYKGEYSVAFEFLERAVAVSESHGRAPDTAKLFCNFGMVLTRMERWSEAESAFEKAIELCQEVNDLASKVWPYNGLGAVLIKQDRLAEARGYHERALALAEDIGDRVMVGVSQMNLGRCACLGGAFVEASEWFESALAGLTQTRFWNGLTLLYEHMAEMYVGQGRMPDALATVDKRIELARRHGNRRMEAAAWEQKARVFERMEQTADAMAALKKSVEISRQPAPYESLHRYLDEVTRRPPFR